MHVSEERAGDNGGRSHKDWWVFIAFGGQRFPASMTRRIVPWCTSVV